jgi:hypothetical protein
LVDDAWCEEFATLVEQLEDPALRPKLARPGCICRKPSDTVAGKRGKPAIFPALDRDFIGRSAETRSAKSRGNVVF